MTPRRLIDVEALKQGETLLQEYRKQSAIAHHSTDRLKQMEEAARVWGDWACVYAGDIMTALKAYAALESILDRTCIEELIWWNTPGVWSIRTPDTPEHFNDEGEGEWNGSTLHEVLCNCAADFAEESEARQ